MTLNKLYPEGTKIYNTSGTEFAVVKSVGDWFCACGSKGKLRVQWPDNSITLICPKGLESYLDGFKIIS